MTLHTLIQNFKNDESGAVTVDWVVLTAAIVGLGIAVIISVSGGVNDLANEISDTLSNGDIGDLNFNGTPITP
jgi:Flp pilus assembly pilin Flp